MRLICSVAVSATALLLAAACAPTSAEGEGARIVDEPAASSADEDETEDVDTAPGVDGEPDDGEPVESDPVEEEAPEEPEAADDAVGTRSNPVPVDTTFAVGDWEISVGATNTDAGDIVAEENMFNEEDYVDGRQLLLVPAGVTYTGDDAALPIDLMWSFVGGDGNSFSYNQDDYCGVVPDDLGSKGEMFSGASTTGNVCIQVPADVIDGGAWMVEDGMSFDNTDRTFIAIS